MKPLQPTWGVKAYIPRTLFLVIFGSFKVPIIQYTKYPIVMPTVKDNSEKRLNFWGIGSLHGVSLTWNTFCYFNSSPCVDLTQSGVPGARAD